MEKCRKWGRQQIAAMLMDTMVGANSVASEETWHRQVWFSRCPNSRWTSNQTWVLPDVQTGQDRIYFISTKRYSRIINLNLENLFLMWSGWLWPLLNNQFFKKFKLSTSLDKQMWWNNQFSYKLEFLRKLIVQCQRFVW